MSEVKRHSVSGYGRQDICYNDPEGEFVYYEDYAALQQKLDAQAAENATIKTMNDVLSEELRGYESDGAYDGPVAHKLWHSNSETPATDAWLNSVRAEGVEMFAELTDKVADEEHYDDGESSELLRYSAKQARLYAAQLRAGKDGE
ncbi:hypothetical protein [Pantoea piersonii]|uniref:hypothetical protein n=1 Tax=Pantoea piersonii TaxID=2364647 RepID=UPI0028A74E05|nr:hypothetical protein [Pantoea piersonii]